MTTLYTIPTHYDPAHRGDLIDLLKPFWGKGDGFSDANRVAMYGISEQDIRFTENINTADLIVLPMSWNYYHREGKLQLAKDLITQAATVGKQVHSWTSGDFGVKVPHFDNLVVLRQSGYRSRLPAYHQGMPVFIGDPLKRFYNRKEIFLREKQDQPVIGFCGQAKGNWQKYLVDLVRTSLRNIKYYTGLSPEDPQDLYPSTLRRAGILDAIERDERLVANFIKREQYRAGADTPEERHRTTLEFYDNMVHSDYVVCVRGGGNFSVRLYETLAMGRIPVFVNTDCLLPLADEIDWRRHVVWVEEEDIGRIGDCVLDFHHNMSDKHYKSLQSENRKLWLEKLNLGVFYNLTLNVVSISPIH